MHRAPLFAVCCFFFPRLLSSADDVVADQAGASRAAVWSSSSHADCPAQWATSVATAMVVGSIQWTKTTTCGAISRRR
jgi:hypothetical protein